VERVELLAADAEMPASTRAVQEFADTSRGGEHSRLPGSVDHQGTGKSHLLEALDHLAVDKGLPVAWFSVEDLGTLMRRHRVDDSLSKAFAALTAVHFTLVDDIRLLPISHHDSAVLDRSLQHCDATSNNGPSYRLKDHVRPKEGGARD